MTIDPVKQKIAEPTNIFAENAGYLKGGLLSVALPVIPDQARAIVAACPRCHGRMFPAGMDGDAACFSCGHVAYAATLPTIDDSKRRPSHGGRSL